MQLDSAAVRLDEAFRQGQAKARAGLALFGIAHLAEFLEHILVLGGVDADTAIDHGDRQLRRGALGYHPDLAAIGRVFDGVREQVVEHLPQPASIGHHDGRCSLCRQLEGFPVGQGTQPGDRLGDGALNIERLPLELHAAGFDLGQVEDVVDECQEVVAAGVDVLHPFEGDTDVFAGVRLAAHQVAEADDRAEWRAQLVAHAREEVALGLACRAQRLHGVAQALAQGLLLTEHLAPLGQQGGLSGEGDQHVAVIRAEQAAEAIDEDQDRVMAIARKGDRLEESAPARSGDRGADRAGVFDQSLEVVAGRGQQRDEVRSFECGKVRRCQP